VIDFNRLLKLRLAVARIGEMDLAHWWNTEGLLGPRGKIVLARGFPHTHYFAQARVVFAVARARSQELFNPPGCMTLWTLPAALEDQFEEQWQAWLDNRDKWAPLFEQLAGVRTSDLVVLLQQLGLVSDDQLETVGKLRRTAENRAVPIAGFHEPTDEVMTLLAAGFSRGTVGNPAVPYAAITGIAR
jgi:hypothetical protein